MPLRFGADVVVVDGAAVVVVVVGSATEFVEAAAAVAVVAVVDGAADLSLEQAAATRPSTNTSAVRFIMSASSPKIGRYATSNAGESSPHREPQFDVDRIAQCGVFEALQGHAFSPCLFDLFERHIDEHLTIEVIDGVLKLVHQRRPLRCVAGQLNGGHGDNTAARTLRRTVILSCPRRVASEFEEPSVEIERGLVNLPFVTTVAEGVESVEALVVGDDEFVVHAEALSTAITAKPSNIFNRTRLPHCRWAGTLVCVQLNFSFRLRNSFGTRSVAEHRCRDRKIYFIFIQITFANIK